MEGLPIFLFLQSKKASRCLRMASHIFINLPVNDLKKSVKFFTALGLSFNPEFTDKNAACLILSDSTFVMLITKSFFKTFTNKDISDARQATEVLIAIQVDSRERIDQVTNKVKKAGGLLISGPQDLGWMYQQSFADLDGHMWELIYMDETELRKNKR